MKKVNLYRDSKQINIFSKFITSVYSNIPKSKELTLILLIISVVSMFAFTLNYISYSNLKSKTLGNRLISASDLEKNSKKYGYIKAYEESEEGDKYLNALLEKFANSSKVDVRLISDINLIKQENPDAGEFYRDAENGDVLIFMLDTGAAFILRPSNNELINFSKFGVQLSE